MRLRGALTVVGISALAALLLVRACDHAPEPGPRNVPSAAPAPSDEGTAASASRRARPAEASDASAPAAVADTVRRVRVVSRSGLPVRGVVVREAATENPRRLALTDADGSANLDDTGRGGDDVVVASAMNAERITTRRGATTTFVLETAIEVRVEVVNGRTGEGVPDAQVRVSAEDTAPTAESVIVRPGERFALPSPGDGAIGPVATFDVSPPDGLVSPGAWTWRTSLGRIPRTAVVTLLVAPPVDQSVRVLSPREEPVPGATFRSARFRGSDGDGLLGRETHPPSVRAEPTDALGRTRIEGLPDLPGAIADVVFAGGIAASSPDLEPIELSGTLRIPVGAAPAEEREVVLATQGLSGTAGTPSPGRRGVGGGIGGGARGPELRVRVVARDGTPAAGVDVRAGRWSAVTDADGLAVLHVQTDVASLGGRRVAVEVPTHVVAAGERFFPSSAAVPAGIAGDVVIRESAPRRVRVEVVRGDGTLLPAATVSVETIRIPTVSGVDLDFVSSIVQFDADGARRLRVLSGPDGRADLEVPPGVCRFRAVAGIVSAAVESEEPFVRITVPLVR